MGSNGCIDKCWKPQRTWVGLTAEEREQVQAESYGKVPHHVALIAAVEAKLKEKNT
jgi:predicted deacylase